MAYLDNNQAPLVSVIMNCFNGEKYLRTAIDSVYAQTYRNWEIIFWDNASTDLSSKIAKSYDDKLKYFCAKQTTVVYEARNYAVEQANGEFLAFLDVDDWWLPTKLEQQIQFFEDSDVGLVYGNYWLRDESSAAVKLAHKKRLPQGYIVNELLNQYVVGLLTIVIRKSSFDSLKNGFNPRYNIIGDFDCVIDIAASCKICCVQEPIAYYRRHSNNLSVQQGGKLIRELKLWVAEKNCNSVVSLQSGFSHVMTVIKYLRGKRFYEKGRYLCALKMFFLMPTGIEKLKLLILLLLPDSIINLLKR